MRYLPQSIIDHVSIKNVKQNFGHDLGGFFCDIYFKKKKIGYLNVDGWGGIPDVEPYAFTDKAKADLKSFETFLSEQKYSEFLNVDYNRTNPSDKNKSYNFQVEEQVNDLCERLLVLKNTTKYEKDAIVFGDPLAGTLRMQRFKYPLEVIIQKNKPIFEKTLDELKKTLTNKEYIFNTNISDYLK